MGKNGLIRKWDLMYEQFGRAEELKRLYSDKWNEAMIETYDTDGTYFDNRLLIKSAGVYNQFDNMTGSMNL